MKRSSPAASRPHAGRGITPATKKVTYQPEARARVRCNGQFDEPALVLVEKAGIIPQAGLRLAFASGIGKLPTVAVLDPPALIAGQPGAVRWPGQKIGQGFGQRRFAITSPCASHP